MTPKYTALSQIPLFAALSEKEMQGLAQRAVERHFPAGEMLFWEGEACAGIFLIAEGSVKIFRTSPGGREVMLAIEEAAPVLSRQNCRCSMAAPIRHPCAPVAASQRALHRDKATSSRSAGNIPMWR